MKYSITQTDKDLLLQSEINYKYTLYIVDNNKNILDEISGIQAMGSYNIDSDSSMRRTTLFTLFLENSFKEESIEDKLYNWIGYNFKLQIGVYSLRTDSYSWYDCGCYLITEANTSYNAMDNSLSTTLSDWYTKFDGTRNGQIGGAPTILIPNFDESGNKVTLKESVEGVLKSNTDITEYIVDDIGEFYGMAQNNNDCVEYRASHPSWNQLPYDLEYNVGCTISDIFSEICEIYPNCQMYFDIYGIFCFNMIPSCEHDNIVLDDDYIQQILLSDNTEGVTYDIESIKNVTEVFGANYDIDFYSSTCSINTNIYTVTISDYSSYMSGDMISFVPNSNNIANMKIRINNLGTMNLLIDGSSDYVKANTLIADNTYVVKIEKVNGVFVAYYLGQFQPHALCVLTNNAYDSKYTKSYFSQKYNCNENQITMRIEPDSPFSVQKKGEILDVKVGDDFENILSDSVAMENAIYYNRKSSSVNDTVTISTVMIPFLDVNVKVRYKKQQNKDAHEYVIKSISNNLESNTSQITMYRFYPLYYA